MTQETQAEGPQVEGLSVIQGELKVSLDNLVRSYLKKAFLKRGWDIA